MSEAILSLKDLGSNNYNTLLSEAVYKNNQDGGAYITSMTKAYLKDGNKEHALKFFED